MECWLYKGVYFNLNFGMLNRTSSHTCDRWYLSKFLLRNGLLTLMYTTFYDSSDFLISLPTILKLSTVVVWPVVIYWRGGLQVFLNLLNVEDSSIYSSSHSIMSHLNLYITPLLLVMWSLSLGATWEIPDGISTSEKYLNLVFSTYVLNALTQAFGVWYYHVCFLFVGGSCCVDCWLLPLLFLSGLDWTLSFTLILFKAHPSWGCFLLDMALCWSMLTTL